MWIWWIPFKKNSFFCFNFFPFRFMDGRCGGTERPYGHNGRPETYQFNLHRSLPVDECAGPRRHRTVAHLRSDGTSPRHWRPSRILCRPRGKSTSQVCSTSEMLVKSWWIVKGPWVKRCASKLGPMTTDIPVSHRPLFHFLYLVAYKGNTARRLLDIVFFFVRSLDRIFKHLPM